MNSIPSTCFTGSGLWDGPPVPVIRMAADVLQAVAQAAPDGPWGVEQVTPGQAALLSYPTGAVVAVLGDAGADLTEACGSYLATVDPRHALGQAVWLRAAADRQEVVYGGATDPVLQEALLTDEGHAAWALALLALGVGEHAVVDAHFRTATALPAPDDFRPTEGLAAATTQNGGV